MLPDARPFPMLDGPPIPWFVAEAIYRNLYGTGGQTLERLAQRGGFGWGEVAYMTKKPAGHVRSPQRCRDEIERDCAALAAPNPTGGES